MAGLPGGRGILRSTSIQASCFSFLPPKTLAGVSLRTRTRLPLRAATCHLAFAPIKGVWRAPVHSRVVKHADVWEKYLSVLSVLTSASSCLSKRRVLAPIRTQDLQPDSQSSLCILTPLNLYSLTTKLVPEVCTLWPHSTNSPSHHRIPPSHSCTSRSRCDTIR